MNVENLRKFVDFAWDLILDMPCSTDCFPDDWERDEDGNVVVVDKAFEELKAAEEAEQKGPMKHACWAELSAPSYGRRFQCSACGNRIALVPMMTKRPSRYYPFCAKCGAKMDEEK